MTCLCYKTIISFIAYKVSFQILLGGKHMPGAWENSSNSMHLHCMSLCDLPIMSFVLPSLWLGTEEDPPHM